MLLPQIRKHGEIKIYSTIRYKLGTPLTLFRYRYLTLDITLDYPIHLMVPVITLNPGKALKLRAHRLGWTGPPLCEQVFH